MTIKMKMLQAAAGVGGGIDIADAFSTDLYTGNGGTQTITNGVDLSGEGGLVWTKVRSAAYFHNLNDTERGDSSLYSNDTSAAQAAVNSPIASYNSNGFSIDTGGSQNVSAQTYVAWTFRKAPKFFDVVTYTGNGVAGRTVAHNLDSVPGMIIVKSLSPRDWSVHHRGVNAQTWTGTATGALTLNSAAANDTGKSHFGTITSTNFAVERNGGDLNASGENYVAYLFAHDTDDDSVIQCGSYTGNGSSTGPVVTLGWEPQWLMIKKASSGSEEWIMFDSVRGMGAGANPRLYASSSGAESSIDYVDSTSTGFEIKSSNGAVNTNAGTYIYMAIRKEGA
jgi:hypothetical protein